MRKDIFVVGVRLLGVMQLVGAMSSLVFIFLNWIGYYQTPSYNQQYYFIHFGVECVLGLYLTLRPYHLFQVIERLSENDIEDQEDSADVKEEPNDK